MQPTKVESEVFALTESQHHHREGRGRIKSGRRRLLRASPIRTAAAVTFVGVLALPFHAAASEPIAASRTQVTVGTLPLLAALGVGIAVAVGAVVAFLQMTAKGKAIAGREKVAGAEDAGAASDAEQAADAEPTWHDEPGGTEAEYEEETITDYTIPVTRILSASDPAEPALGDEPRLCGIEGEHAGASYRLLGRKLLIGRDAIQCGIVFPYEAGEVSRRHCTVKYDEETKRFLLEDHGSSNGTFLAGGERLVPGRLYELHDGDRFSLSGAQHTFEVKTGA